MPVTTSYPGVYIEELPSGVNTITGVATSITVFIGRAEWGPVSTPTVITSFSDYDRMFGGLWANSMMSFAVNDFYQNGGSQGIIVRLTSDDATTATLDLPQDTSIAPSSPPCGGVSMRPVPLRNSRGAGCPACAQVRVRVPGR